MKLQVFSDSRYDGWLYFKIDELLGADHHFYRLFELVDGLGRLEVELVADKDGVLMLDGMFDWYFRTENPPWIGAVSGDGKVTYFPKHPRGSKIIVSEHKRLKDKGKVFFK